MSNYRAKRYDVAKIAGVSEATVSFVFSGKRYVSPKLTSKVKEAAEKLDYQPDSIARSMVTKSTDTIAVLTSDIASPLQMEVIKSIQEEAIKKGYFVNVCGGIDHFEKYIDNFITRRIDGIFLSVNADLVTDEYIKKLVNKGISVIITSTREIDDERICGIKLDFESGMNQIIDYLISLGHTKIAYLSNFDDNYPADERLKSFRSTITKKIGNIEPLVQCNKPPYDSTIETGIKLAEELLKTTEDFTALVCSNDLMAMGAMSVLESKGFLIPQDISVIGIDDIMFSKAYNPPLTTLSHNAKEYGKKIFEILHDNIMNKTVVQKIVIEPKLIIRKSTATCPNW